MSTVSNEAASTDEPLPNLLFDYRDADIILRSQDCYHLRVPRIFIIHNSTVLDELIQRTLDSSSNADVDASLPVVQLPERGEILHNLLTFICPVTPLLPATPDEIMELLSVAQKYRMEIVLTHIRGNIARRNSLPTGLEATLRIYALAQKYGLRSEALQAARVIFLKQAVNIDYLDGMLDIIPGASLYELWKYQERFRTIITSDLTEFEASGARGTMSSLRCTELSSSRIPRWINIYIEGIGLFPNYLDYVVFSHFMARHINDNANKPRCNCASIPIKVIREFWEHLASVVDGSFEKVNVANLPSCLGY